MAEAPRGRQQAWEERDPRSCQDGLPSTPPLPAQDPFPQEVTRSLQHRPAGPAPSCRMRALGSPPLRQAGAAGHLAQGAPPRTPNKLTTRWMSHPHVQSVSCQWGLKDQLPGEP